jgi:hypothetical protein
MSQTPQQSQPPQSNNLIFIGSVKTRIGINGLEQMQLGFNQDHINLLLKHLNVKGWVNIQVLNGKNGKYMIVKNSEDQNIGHE